ncbi:glycosyltransferase family 4 protein [Muribacter muris]|uniref:Glycosyltransferase family 4 protein n=1 Tax=Muribacter muris TaxID=67855 RepID=A0A4Y9K2K6_9PAST|nr:glycosyltransferase family 4 protein [Muribacter muris]MBF0784791.1 glycosyltransferase family 4 protein [Muribacter muris]MBF0826650.1 glycosyltransferase family 4 protein [Muribacter muris]TFV11027.1 glycosyltransferase family 4 protein [Muribacter muris]
MKKVCFFGGNLNNSGGTERVSTSIANGLVEQGYDVIMLNLYEGLEPFFELHSNIQNYQLYSGKISGAKHYISTIRKLRTFIKHHGIETLIVVESMLSLFSLPSIIGLQVKHITWEHFNYNVDLGKKARRFSRHLSRLLSDNIVTLTEKDKQIWQKNTFGKAEIIAIPNPSPYPISDHTPSLDNKVVLAIGRLTYQKGFDLLLQAWAIVKQNEIARDWTLQILGEGEDKPLLNSLIQELNLGQSVVIYPFSNQVSSYYQKASIFCMSSRFEGLGMVILEAQCFGLPCISFDCEIGPSEIIKHNQSGYLCEPENINSLADQLITLMSLNNSDYLKMSNESKKNIAQKFNTYSIIEQWNLIL